MSLKEQAFRGFKWTFLQQLFSQITGLSLVIILGRLLTPTDYGLLGMIYVIFTISNVLLDSGFSNSLVRDADADDYHFSVIFNFNIVIGIVLYLIVFISAPFIANFFHQKILIDVVRVYAISIILNSLTTTQQAYLTKYLHFKILALSSIISGVLGGMIGVIMALNNYHVWSLVFTTLISIFSSLCCLWIASKWKPRLFVFDKNVLKKHFSFGYKLTITNLLDGIVRNVINVLFGRLYQPSVVGYYSRSESMKNIFVNLITNTFSKVSFPIISMVHNDNTSFNNKFRQLLNGVAFISVPTLIFIALFSKEIIILLFTNKWIDMNFYLTVLALSGMLYPVTTLHENALSIKGKSDLVLKVSVICKAFFILFVSAGYFLGNFKTMVTLLIPYSLFELLLHVFFTKKILNKYLIKDQIIDLLRIFLATILALPFLQLLNFLSNNVFLYLITQLTIFALCYIFFSYLINRKMLMNIISFIK